MAVEGLSPLNGLVRGAQDAGLLTAAPSGGARAIVFDHVSFAFDDHVVLDDVSFDVPRGSLRFLLGASGSGKSVLLKLALGLLRPDSGQIEVNGARMDCLPERELLQIRADIGMVFQENALFDSLTVAENVGYRLYEETKMPLADVRRRVEEVLGFIGLEELVERMPSELSGGQRRRVSVARAMASRPGILLFDDPTTGLDPLTSISVNDEIVKLRDLEQVTVVAATHQMRDAFYVANHVAARATDGRVTIVPADHAGVTAAPAEFLVLHHGRLHFRGTADELLASDDPFLKEFLYKTLPPW
jgi:phospholipid/cholesterol/gamma-HCH transport system ATP-binding protein